MGENPETALKHTLELAQWTEELGYHRYWVAEHHNTNGLAGSSPEILMTRIASVTNRIRVGSGGILFIVCAETEETAEELAITQDKWLLNVGKGLGTKVTSIEDIRRNTLSREDREIIRKNTRRMNLWLSIIFLTLKQRKNRTVCWQRQCYKEA